MNGFYDMFWRENTVYGDDKGEKRVDSESYRDESETSRTIQRIGGEAGATGGLEGEKRLFVRLEFGFIVLLNE